MRVLAKCSQAIISSISGGNVYTVTATHLSPELLTCFARRASYLKRKWLWGHTRVGFRSNLFPFEKKFKKT